MSTVETCCLESVRNLASRISAIDSGQNYVDFLPFLQYVPRIPYKARAAAYYELAERTYKTLMDEAKANYVSKQVSLSTTICKTHLNFRRPESLPKVLRPDFWKHRIQNATIGNSIGYVVPLVFKTDPNVST